MVNEMAFTSLPVCTHASLNVAKKEPESKKINVMIANLVTLTLLIQNSTLLDCYIHQEVNNW